MKHGSNMLTRAFFYLVNERPIPTILGSAGVSGGATAVTMIEKLTPWLQFGTLLFGCLTAIGGFALFVRQAYRAAKEDFGKKG